MRVLGDYELVSELGFGGMGSVHLAFKRGGLSKPVAVKVIHPQFAQQAPFVEMFLDEVRVAAAMQHRNVVRVLDISSGDVANEDPPFVVLEYVSGLDLGQVAKGGPLEPGLVARILADAARGLHHAHLARDPRGALNLVHRDVSPQNILIGYDGVVKVTDFGIAKAERRLSQTTATGRLKGKCAYLAPEQVTRGATDHRVDVFALGVVAWEMLAGRALFRAASDAETLMNVVNAEIPQLNVPTALHDVVTRALAKSPEERWSTAKAMADALDACACSPSKVIEEMSRSFAKERDEAEAVIQRHQERHDALHRGRRDELQTVETRVSPNSIPPRRITNHLVAWGFMFLFALLVVWVTTRDTDVSVSPVAPIVLRAADAHTEQESLADEPVVEPPIHVSPSIEPRQRSDRPSSTVRVREATEPTERVQRDSVVPMQTDQIAQRTCGNGVAVFRAGTEARIQVELGDQQWGLRDAPLIRREWSEAARRCYDGHDVYDGLSWFMHADGEGRVTRVRSATACPTSSAVRDCMESMFTSRPVTRRVAGEFYVSIRVSRFE